MFEGLLNTFHPEKQTRTVKHIAEHGEYWDCILAVVDVLDQQETEMVSFATKFCVLQTTALDKWVCTDISLRQIEPHAPFNVQPSPFQCAHGIAQDMTET